MYAFTRNSSFPVLIVVIPLLYAACGDGRIEEFSAVQVALDPAGAEVSRHALNATQDKMRMETDSPMGRGVMYVILRKDMSLTWIVNPERSTYIERPMHDGEWDRVRRTGWIVLEENIGRDTVSGISCTKKRVELKAGSAARAVVWVSDRLDLPLRTRREDGQAVELRDIRQGLQPDSLFEVPEGFIAVGDFVSLFGRPQVAFPRPGGVRPGKASNGP